MTTNPFDFNRLEEGISITNHNPAWSQWYLDEVTALARALIDINPHFEHVGSSAIVGLKSKPIVDIMMGLDSLELPVCAQSTLLAMGYEYFGRLHENQKRLFARKRGERSFNLQVVPYRGEEWTEKLVFRDYLRSHPEDVVAYSAIKEEAIGAGMTTLLEYHKYKDLVVTKILRRAMDWNSLK